MNRYHRPVLNVGASDKKIFLKTASKKRKLYVFFAILIIIGGLSVYRIQANRQTDMQGIALGSNTLTVIKENVVTILEHAKDWFGQVYTSIQQRYQQQQELKKQELDFILQEYSENENLSKVVFGKSWVGQKLFEKHQLTDFATVKLNRFYQVNRNAYILAETPKKLLGVYPILSGPWSQKESHSLTEEDRRILEQGIELLALFNQYPKISTILSEVNYNPDYGWVLFSTAPGMTVTLGRKDFQEKAQRLLRVMDQYHGNVGSVKSIDLDYSELAIVKLRKGEQHGQS
ncbi:MAG TPA: cell division protein FtsQ/DivIB [Oligoflexia bacterium]|mgnify:CR=1 FL=1|nr:cell division protein FtsQ/DivIB [Oligoflexia bacterium]HMR24528.1 cell division protein FtsQ/DivIB [Oligoflexia bacterium]